LALHFAPDFCVDKPTTARMAENGKKCIPKTLTGWRRDRGEIARPNGRKNIGMEFVCDTRKALFVLPIFIFSVLAMNAPELCAA
jgi:hypothetical protein